MKKVILAAVFGAVTLGLNAGDWGKAPLGKAPIEECIDLGGEISVGWMSDYIFYGERFAKSSFWGDVNYTFEGLAVPITIGAWYLTGMDPNNIAPLGAGYDELDLYATIELGTFWGFDTTVGYWFFTYPRSLNQIPDGHELSFDVSRSLGFIDFAAEADYQMNLNAWYYQVGFSKTFGITDRISLELGAGVGYSDNYQFTDIGDYDTGWNHYYLSASLPIQLNCRTTLTPYVGFNGATNGMLIDNTAQVNPVSGEDVLHGGVSLSVTF